MKETSSQLIAVRLELRFSALERFDRKSCRGQAFLRREKLAVVFRGATGAHALHCCIVLGQGYFVPLFCFILPFSLGMVLILVGTLLHELDHRGRTNPTKSHTAFVLLGFVLDAAGLIFLCSIGVKAIYSLLSEPGGGLNLYLSWIYWSGLLYCSLTVLSLCCQLFLLRRMFVQHCGCTCCKEKEDEDEFYQLNIEDEAAMDLVGELETENFEGGKQRTSSSLNYSNDDVPKFYKRDPYNFYDRIATICLGLGLVACIVLFFFGIA